MSETPQKISFSRFHYLVNILIKLCCMLIYIHKSNILPKQNCVEKLLLSILLNFDRKFPVVKRM